MARATTHATQGFVQRFLGGLKFPQVFTLLASLFVLDFFLPDPIPFIDEIIVGLLALLLGLWKDRGDQVPFEGKPAVKNITPRD